MTILRIESLPEVGEIIHVRIEGIRLRNCTGGPSPKVIEHMPFTRSMIEKSAIVLLSTGSVPSYEAGYDQWRNACGGVYTIPVMAAVAVDEATFNQQYSCKS